MYPYAIVRDKAVFTSNGDCIVGIDDAPLSEWTLDGLSIIVSESSPAQDPEAFLEVVSQICDRQTAIPAQATDEPLTPDSAERLLRAGRDRFTNLLDLFDGVEEWSIRIDPGPKTDRADSSASTGRSYLDQRRLELAEAAGIDPSASLQSAKFTKALSPIAREVKLLPASDGAACVAVLLSQSQVAQLDGVFEQAAQGSACPCTLSGPWPPFSFASLAA